VEVALAEQRADRAALGRFGYQQFPARRIRQPEDEGP
jgi:hypothetical protein